MQFKRQPLVDTAYLVEYESVQSKVTSPSRIDGFDTKKKNDDVPNSNLYVLEANYVESSSLSGIVDLEATNHVCSSLPVLNSWKQLEDKELTLKVGNGESVLAKIVGEARLAFKENFFVDKIYLFHSLIQTKFDFYFRVMKIVVFHFFQ